MQEGNNQPMATDQYEKEVFVSYAWGGESERTVNELEQAFAEHGIRIVRDKKELDYKGSIEAFEQRIGQGQCIVLVISDKYLRSKHCMYELLAIDRNRSTHERIFPIVLLDSNIYNDVDRLGFVTYWDNEIEKLNQAIKQVKEMTGLAGFFADLEKHKLIRDNFDHLTSLLSDMNALKPEIHAANGYSTLISTVERAMAGKQTASMQSNHTITLNKISGDISKPLLNPFFYSRPVQPSEFVNREDDLNTVFNRLRNGESTAIVGGPHIGKSSFLGRLADTGTISRYLSDTDQVPIVSRINLQYINNDFSPAIFWERALKPLQKLQNQDDILWRLEQLTKANYSGDSLEAFFEWLSKIRVQLVLLLDEFELLLIHPHFQEFSFYATLGAIDESRSFSICLVSCCTLGELEERVQKLAFSSGSPVFDRLTQVRLQPFVEEKVNALLNWASGALTSNDRRFIRFMAGGHPYLVQAMAATLLETNGENRYAHAAGCYYDRICRHFDYIWRTLDNRMRTTAVILGLLEYGRFRLGENLDNSGIENLERLGARLRDLARLGLADQVSTDLQSNARYLLWQNERWTLEAQAFTCWIYDVAIAETRSVPDYEEWLMTEGYNLLLTKAQWEHLLGIARRATGTQIQNIGTMAEEMFWNSTGESANA